MYRVLAHRTYRRLFIAQVVALAGTGLATVALGLLTYDLAGNDAGLVLGIAFAVKMIAYVVVAPTASALLARISRRVVLVSADIVRLVAALALPFVGSTWQIVAVIFVLQAASATFTPAFQSVIPDVLPDEDDYTSALSLSRMAYDLEAVLSPLLAGLVLVVVSSSTLFFGTAAGFLGSALLVLSVSLPRAEQLRGAGGADARPGERVRHGVLLFLRTGPLRSVLALNLTVAAAGSYVLVQTVVIVRDTLGGSEGLVPVVLAASGLGSLAAASVLPAALRRVDERRVMLCGAGLLVLGMVLVPPALSMGRAGGVAAICVLWAVIGVGWSAVETPVGRLIRRHTLPGDRPAAFAAQFSLSHVCWLVTYPLAGWLGGQSLTATACYLGVVAMAATLVAARLWRTGVTTAVPTRSGEDVEIPA